MNDKWEEVMAGNEFRLNSPVLMFTTSEAHDDELEFRHSHINGLPSPKPAITNGCDMPSRFRALFEKKLSPAGILSDITNSLDAATSKIYERNRVLIASLIGEMTKMGCLRQRIIQILKDCANEPVEYFQQKLRGLSRLFKLNWSNAQMDYFLGSIDRLSIDICQVAIMLGNSKIDEIFKSYTASPDAFLGVLESNHKKNVSFFGRYLLSQLVSNTKGPDPMKKRALFVLNKKDWNSAFMGERNLIKKFERRGYSIGIYETENDKEFYDIVISEGALKPIDALLVGGHGTKSSILLGQCELDRGDLAFLDNDKISKLRGSFTPNARIVLEACSTGNGGRKDDNFATFFASLSGVEYLFANPNSSSIDDVYFNSRGLIKGVDWYVDIDERTMTT